MPETERRSDRHRRQQMRGVETTDGELVANVGPGGLSHELDIETFGLGETHVDGDNERGGVDKRHEADPQFLRPAHFSSSAAVTIARAISPIFFFSRMAALRRAA